MNYRNLPYSSSTQAKAIDSALLNASSALRMLYVTPEKLAKSKRLMNKLEKAAEMGRLKVSVNFAVDLPEPQQLLVSS